MLFFFISPSLLLKLRNVVATQSAEIWDTTFDFTGFYFLAEIILMTWPAPPTLHYISLISVFPCMMLNIKCLDAVHVFMCNCVLCIPPWPTLAWSFTTHSPHPSLLLTKTEFSVNTPWPKIGRWNTALVQQKILSFLNFISWHIIRSFAITIRVIFMLENLRSLLFVLCFRFA